MSLLPPFSHLLRVAETEESAFDLEPYYCSKWKQNSESATWISCATTASTIATTRDETHSILAPFPSSTSRLVDATTSLPGRSPLSYINTGPVYHAKSGVSRQNAMTLSNSTTSTCTEHHHVYDSNVGGFTPLTSTAAVPLHLVFAPAASVSPLMSIKVLI